MDIKRFAEETRRVIFDREEIQYWVRQIQALQPERIPECVSLFESLITQLQLLDDRLKEIQEQREELRERERHES